MDGNVRWSNKKKLTLKESYSSGASNLLKLTEQCFKIHKIRYVSAFALSKHNMQRPKISIKAIITVLDYYLDEILLNSDKYNFNIKFIGDYLIFNVSTQKKIYLIQNRKVKSKKTLVIAINYSSRSDIENAAKYMIKKNEFQNYLSTRGIPDPDILIRTGGFQRLSDFFLYELSFTELFFTKVLWPDFTRLKLNIMLNKFYGIERKFGK